MVYSNNYSTYIEKLKIEKNRAAFKRLVESTKENKVQEIYVEEAFSEKAGNVVSSQDSLLESKNEKTIYADTKNSDKTRESISDNYPYANPDEYRAVTTEYRVNNASKASDNIEAAEDFSHEQNGKKVDKVEDYSSKKETDISNEFDLTNKSYEDIIYEYSVSERTSKTITPDNTVSSKVSENINNEEPNTSKSERDIILSIIEEKKNGKILSDEAKNNSKVGYQFDYLLARPKKQENIYPGLDVISVRSVINSFEEKRYVSPLETSPKQYEESEYATYANDEYKYYPEGTYSQGASVQREAIGDVVKTITNPSNWSSFGSVLVSGIKIASDLVDMISLTGPSTNLYDYRMANDLRKDLKLKDKYFAKGKKTDNYYVKGEEYDDGLNEGYQLDFVNTDVDITKSDNDSNLDELTNQADESGTKADKNNIEDGENNAKLKLKDSELTNQADESGTKSDNDSKLDDLANQANKDRTTIKREVHAYDVHEIHGDISGLEKITEFASDNEKSDKVSNLDELTNQADEDNTKADKNNIEEDGENNAKLKLNNNELTNQADNESKKEIKFVKEVDDATYNETFSFANEPLPSRWFDVENKIGKIYVMPPYSELSKAAIANEPGAKNINVAFTIPLQNNLQFEQTSRGATWVALQFFGRIGDVQQYSKTNSLDSLTLTTKYFVDSETSSGFTMRRLQDIEMMYRSLVLPIESTSQYLTGDENSNFYYFTRPPIINIVLGKDNNTSNFGIPAPGIINDNEPYKNLFTDVVSTYEGGKLQNKFYYKNFVVTNVSIDKNQNDYNYYVKSNQRYSSDGDYLDSMGFTVSLTVIEIDENYLGSLPSFNNYYNILGKSNSVTQYVNANRG